MAVGFIICYKDKRFSRDTRCIINLVKFKDRTHILAYWSESQLRGYAVHCVRLDRDEFKKRGDREDTERSSNFEQQLVQSFNVRILNDILDRHAADGLLNMIHANVVLVLHAAIKLSSRRVFIQMDGVIQQYLVELFGEPAFRPEFDANQSALLNVILVFQLSGDLYSSLNMACIMAVVACHKQSNKHFLESIMQNGSFINENGICRGSSNKRISNDYVPGPLGQLNIIWWPVAVHYTGQLKIFGSPDSEVRGEMRGPRSERSSVSHNDETSSTTSEKYERDVAILNSCFDDIERFIARLQHTAAATRELERRRRSRKSKKKDIGDGLLSMRAKPPPELEFVDIFQKFKLSFNLLAKLKAHIHDPNAPELVHFLFTPLALIVDASRDSNYGPNLPSKVLSPLLSLDAIDLLTNCLTSRETELWQSLGEPWCIPRNAWKYPVNPYQPVFSNGWAPELLENSRELSNVLASEVASEAKIRSNHRELLNMRGEPRNEDYDYSDSDHHEASPPPMAPYYPRSERRGSMTPPSEYPPPGRSDISQDSMDQPTFERHQRQWLTELKTRGAKIVQVTYPRTANNDKELTVVRGEYLEVMDDSRKWWKAMNARGQVAHVPHTIVTPYTADQDGNSDYRPDARRNPPAPVWKERQGKKATVPSAWDFSDEDYDLSDTGTMESSEDEEPRKRSPKPSIVPAPPPPPPQDFTPQSTIRIVKTERPKHAKNLYGNCKSITNQDMNEELKLVLETFRQKRPHLEINKTPDVYITQHSTSKEVKHWLDMKGFEKRIQKQFEGVDGEKIFALSKEQLEGYCGKLEGDRLNSQITIQRNISGYKTTRSSELKQILAQQRKKIDKKKKETQEDTPKQRKNKDTKKDEAQEDITNDFLFLKDYDHSGYQTDSESEDEVDKGKNTLKEQIRKQRRKMTNNTFDDKASR
ncbi:unnamed protein product, partial [Meganyctiphanes norvegica]